MYKTHTEIIKSFLGIGFYPFIYCQAVTVDLRSALCKVDAFDFNILHVPFAFIVDSEVGFHNISAGSSAPLKVEIH